jgi:hypothetical protein
MADTGCYLAIYNMAVTNSSGTDRVEYYGQMYFNGSAYHNYGTAGGYCTNNATDGDYDLNFFGAQIFESTAADTSIDIRIARTDTNTGTTSMTRTANMSGLQILKLNDSWKYFIAYRTSVTNLSRDADWHNIPWEYHDATTSDYQHNPAVSDGQITLVSDGHYLVCAGVRFSTTEGGNQCNLDSRLTVGGAEVPGAVTCATLSANGGCDNGIVSIMSVVESTAASQVLALQVAQTQGKLSSKLDILGGSISIVRLPSSGKYIKLTHSSTQGSDTNRYINFDTEIEKDSPFTHSTVTNNQNIVCDSSGEYLFCGGGRTSRTPAGGSIVHHSLTWRTNSSELQYSGDSAFNLGEGGQYDNGISAANSGAIITVDSSDYVSLYNTAWASSDTCNYTTSVGLQAIHLLSIFPTGGPPPAPKVYPQFGSGVIFS